jgi:hypothetical protein
MKDTRFIELVNLYIDRQISPEETAELETEIQANPRRRQIYHQYCHMHRATKLVYESFRAHVDQPAGAAAQPGSIAYFAQRRQRVRRNFWLSAAAGLAAAACVAVYLVRSNNGPAATIAANPAPAAKVVAAVPAPAPAAVAAKAATQPDYAALLTAMRQNEPRTYAITPSPAVRPVSLFDDGVFDGKPALTPDGHRAFQTKGNADNRQNAEVTAFQFQR